MGHTGPNRQVVDFSKSIDASRVEEQTVLITGGASGMGAQMAASFAERKARVTIADINESLGQDLAKQLAGRGLFINFIKTDVTCWESQVAAFKSAINFGGHESINIVCAVAGVAGVPFIIPNEDLASLDRDPPKPPMVDAVYDVNAKGVYYTSKLAQHYFGLAGQAGQQQRNKVLIMISSIGGYFEFNHVEYCSIMDTPMSSSFAEMCRARGIAIGEVSKVVDAVVRCAADESINGRALAIGAEKSFDLEDDLIGFNSGKVMFQYHQSVEAKTLMEWQDQRP